MPAYAFVDSVLPRPGGRVDRASAAARSSVSRALFAGPLAPVGAALRGNDWLGHPLHPVVVAVPVGAWSVTAWYDLLGAVTGDDAHRRSADAALDVGIVGALAAAATGLAQYPDTDPDAGADPGGQGHGDGSHRREAAVHAALNNVALGLYLASRAARRAGRRPLGAALAGAGLALVGASGYLGGDLSYRHGVGVAAGGAPT